MNLSFSKVANTVWPQFNNVTIIRGDLIHPVVSGNKLYKLLPIIQRARQSQASTLISVGGRYSNHLHALAWAAKESGLQSVGLIRGYPDQKLTPTLEDCKAWGMSCHFISHGDYLNRYHDDFWRPWLTQYPASLRIDEGGWGKDAILGSAGWWASIPSDVDLVVTAVGSGSTYAGLLLSKPQHVDVVGVPVFNDTENYQGLIQKLQEVGVGLNDIQLWQNQAGKGFGKLDSDQNQFKTRFEQAVGVELDPVYTAKVFYALERKLAEDLSLSRRKIAVIHTGGLQGNRS